MQLKLISLNLRGYVDWSSREQHILSFLETEQADLVLFQEVFFDAAHSPYNQAGLLNRQLRQPYEYTQASISKFYQPSSGDAYREGLAVLSRLPIHNSEVLVLEKQPDDKHTRIVMNVDIKTDTDDLLVTNVHLSNNKYSVTQLSELLMIVKHRNERRIIAGDFNIFDLNASGVDFRSDYTASTDITDYISYPSENRTLDYLLVPHTHSLTSLKVVPGLSDHNAVIALLEL